jgi:hypothetical protein
VPTGLAREFAAGGGRWRSRNGRRPTRARARRRPTLPPPFPLTLHDVGEEARDDARAVVARAAARAPRPVLHARVALRVHADAAVERPAEASVALDVGGRLVRAHGAARTLPEALDLAERRLLRNLDDLAGAERVRRRRRESRETAA